MNEIGFNLLRKFQANEPDIQKLIRSLYRKYVIVELDRRILLHASDLRGSYRFSFWDSLVVASALATGFVAVVPPAAGESRRMEGLRSFAVTAHAPRRARLAMAYR